MFVSVAMKGSCSAGHPLEQKGAGNGHAMKHDQDANSSTSLEIMTCCKAAYELSDLPVAVFSFRLQNIF